MILRPKVSEINEYLNLKTRIFSQTSYLFQNHISMASTFSTGKRRPHGKIFLIVVSILPFSSTFVSFFITIVLSAKKWGASCFILLFHFVVSSNDCFLLALLLFRNDRQSGTGRITTRQKWVRRGGTWRGTVVGDKRFPYLYRSYITTLNT